MASHWWEPVQQVAVLQNTDCNINNVKLAYSISCYLVDHITPNFHYENLH